MSPTGISWAEETWNPTIGCERVSPGCESCYAIDWVHRGLHPDHRGLTHRVTVDGRPRTDWTGEVRELPDRLRVPYTWKHPTRVFVGSLSDLFAPQVSTDFLHAVFAVMADLPQHQFMVLTKRPQRMARLVQHDRVATPDEVDQGYELGIVPLLAYDRDLSHVGFGVSVENAEHLWRIPHLLAVPYGFRFVSFEPLLGPIDCPPEFLRVIEGRAGTCFDIDGERWHRRGQCRSCSPGVQWAIVGGESGRRARPMHPDWARALRDRCAETDTAFHFKQWGEWSYAGDASENGVPFEGGHRFPGPGLQPVMRRVGTKVSGRLLDGRLHDDQAPMPARSS